MTLQGRSLSKMPANAFGHAQRSHLYMEKGPLAKTMRHFGTQQFGGISWVLHMSPRNTPSTTTAPSTSSHFYQRSPRFAKQRRMPDRRKTWPFFFFSKMRSQYPKSTFQMQLQDLHNWNFCSNLITSLRQFLTSGDYKWEFVVNIAKKKGVFIIFAIYSKQFGHENRDLISISPQMPLCLLN